MSLVRNLILDRILLATVSWFFYVQFIWPMSRNPYFSLFISILWINTKVKYLNNEFTHIMWSIKESRLYSIYFIPLSTHKHNSRQCKSNYLLNGERKSRNKNWNHIASGWKSQNLTWNKHNFYMIEYFTMWIKTQFLNRNFHHWNGHRIFQK